MTASHDAQRSAYAAREWARWSPADGGTTLLLFPVPELTPAAARILRGVLDKDECARADRFRQAIDRDTCVLTRAVLRHLLAGWTGRVPADVAFAYTSHGKPMLVAGGDRHFNVAHSCGVAAIALSSGGRVGVDVEAIDRARAAPETAQSFSPHERRLLQQCPPERYTELFFRLWTLKEAYLKARGEGLSIALDAFEFTPQLDGQATGFCSRLGDDANDWHFHSGRTFASHQWSLALDARRDTGQLQVVEIPRPLQLLGAHD